MFFNYLFFIISFSPCCIQSDTNTSSCTHHCCDIYIYILYIYIYIYIYIILYLEAVIQRFSLKQVNLFYVYSGNSRGGAHFQLNCRLYVCRFGGGWAPSWVFLKYFPYFIIYCVNGFFGETALSDCFIILSTLFILTYMEGKFSGEDFSRVDF